MDAANPEPTNRIERVRQGDLESLAAAFDELPCNATLPQWAKAWEKLASETGLLKTLNQNNDEPVDSSRGTD